MNGKAKLRIDNSISNNSGKIINLSNKLNKDLTNQKIFGIHGGGNIGLGLMAPIVSEATSNYKIVATSNNTFLCNLINAQNKLWLQHGNNKQDVTKVNNVTMISRKHEDVVKLYKEADIIALCVTPTVLPSLSNDIAQGLLERFNHSKQSLKILILMNKPNCADFVREHVENEMNVITQDKLLAQKILANIEFVPTIIDRIVTPIHHHTIKSELKKQLLTYDKGELYKKLGEKNIEMIISDERLLTKAVAQFKLRCHLFNAEKNFSMYIPSHFSESKQFPLMKTTNNLQMVESIKNKYINGPHAILAWTGALLGFEKIADAINHPILYAYINAMIDEEIAPILCTEYPELTEEELADLKEVLLTRCHESKEDTVLRVGKDPLRKLDSGERVRGTIEFAQKNAMKISTKRLELGIAAGILYATKFDSNNPECQQIKNIYEENERSFYATLCYHGKSPCGKFTGLCPNKDQSLIQRILGYINQLNKIYHTQIQEKSKPSIISLPNLYLNKFGFSFASSSYFTRYKQVEPKSKNNEFGAILKISNA